MSIEFQTVGQLRALLADLPAGLPIMCQVVATNGQAWNLVGQFEGKCLGNFAVLQMKHDDLSSLQWPAQETRSEPDFCDCHCGKCCKGTTQPLGKVCKHLYHHPAANRRVD